MSNSIARRVLVVDDNRKAADSVKTLLELMGHHAAVAYGGELALSVARSFSPEVVLLDLAMPEPDGFEVAQKLREILGEAVKIVALSGFDPEQFLPAFNQAGFDGYILKPATADRLEQTLKQHQTPPPN